MDATAMKTAVQGQRPHVVGGRRRNLEEVACGGGGGVRNCRSQSYGSRSYPANGQQRLTTDSLQSVL
jgi:hypothetical protein